MKKKIIIILIILIKEKKYWWWINQLYIFEFENYSLRFFGIICVDYYN